MNRLSLDAGESEYGQIYSVSGPVIIAENMIGCAMYELVKVGHENLVGKSFVLQETRPLFKFMKKRLVLLLVTLF